MQKLPAPDFTVLHKKRKLIAAIALPMLALGAIAAVFNEVFFYNEAGQMTHVRTIFGEEKVVEDVGYATKWFGRSTVWRRTIGVQSALRVDNQEDNRSGQPSVILENLPIVFLGNVDAKAEFSTQFRLPSGDAFLKIAQEYRTPDNFLQRALLPAVKETLQATASLMSADDYYAGNRSHFGAEFENQLRNGLYLTSRKEIRVQRDNLPAQTAILQSGTDQGSFGDNSATRFVIEKKLDKDGQELRKQQQFRLFGVEVVDARVTHIDPNPQYQERMVRVQQALAELAVARQNRLKEEEEKELVSARGAKDVEAKRQESLRQQIERTTEAETEKQLTLINAEREKRRAEIDKQTAELLRDKAKVNAEATKITADAEAYAREASLKADGALQTKLDALVQINRAWANAAAQAPVPSVMMGGSDAGLGRQDEMGKLMSVLATKAAKDLVIDLKTP
ncbi:membrane protease subunit, stomatin/prohibitin [Pseudomonas sp. 250J]|uniref:SPFH domain-containing protein n=1 Tax=Pseudomonas peradeniyensis TaxID=2745488 RepID=A0ABT2VE40_9PSED|nr:MULTISPECIES: SPFH domain-containing protein [Pseudomonas]KNX77420.1 membrane protease subunit, stomatin/prohibitin [Pseudomonas sp. 250J]MCU7239548.1 SPFH domain-containing protein [Pseudomonas peradeniyensis]MCU7280823.1 SPFH domain-containing protein [Pseudomonas peradeniyensis]QZA56493.1 membrane protease subunit, stomatin/prohibitin [Pseudomonas sp. 2hn]